MKTPLYRLTYFNIQGRAEVIRMILRYSNVEFEDIRINYPTWKTMEKPHKFKFGQLPILEIDDKVIAQTQVIARYLSRKFGYLPIDPDAALPIEELNTFIDSDISERQSIGGMFKDPEQKENYRHKYFTEHLPSKLIYLEDILQKNKTGYLIGDKMTLADFALVDFAQRVLYDKDWVERTKPVLERFPNTTDYLQKRFEDPKYKAYLEKKPKQN